MKRLTLLLMMFLMPLSAAHASKRSSNHWWNKAVFYQIFPLSFYDSDANGKGDLKGITEKLDYLKDLGITAIWLNPIHPAPKGAYHGYAVLDYFAVNPILGDMDGFKKLIKAAHKRGIKIILDLVMNHSSKYHPWFLSSAHSKKSRYANWYLWKKHAPSGWDNASGNTRLPAWNEYKKKGDYRNGWYYYSAFNFSIPDFNHTNPVVKKEFHKIAKFWLDKGVDGFRVDAVRYLIETGPGKGEIDTQKTIDYINTFAKYVKSIKPDAYVIGEVYAGLNIASKYYKKGGMDAVFNFDISGKGGTIQGTLQSGRTRALTRNLQELLDKDKSVPFTYFSPFFSNHDSGRMPENLRSPDKVQTAAALLFTLPGGAPYIYYGDEIGEREGYNLIGDANKRNPMYWNSSHNAGFTTRQGVWVRKMKKYYMDPKDAKTSKEKKEAENLNVAAEQKEPQSTWHMFKTLITLRKSSPALQTGDYEGIDIDMDKLDVQGLKPGHRKKKSLVSFIRVKGNDADIVLINTGRKTVIPHQTFASEKLGSLKNWKIVDSIVSGKLGKPLPENIKGNLLNNRLNFPLESRAFVIVHLKKKSKKKK